jgi:hypothetical protein
MYTTNWSFHIEHSINKAYGNNIPQRDLNIVEIGCFEGRGTNILKDKLCKTDACKIFCIDPWEDVYVKGESAYSDIDFYFNNQYDRFINNTKDNKHVVIMRGYSNDMIPMLPNNIDFAYIDGDHSPNQVYADGKNILPKMNSGGIIVFDDYKWVHNNKVCKDGIDKFVEEYKHMIDVIDIDYQLIARVK